MIVVIPMWSEEEFIKLDEEEYNRTTEEILAALAILSFSKEDIEKELSYFYQKYGKNNVVTYLEAMKKVSNQNRKKRLAVLHLAIIDIFESTFKKFEKNLKAHLIMICKDEIKFFNVDIPIEDILKKRWGLDDLTWNDRLWAYKSKWGDTIYNDLLVSLLKKDSLDEVLKNMDKRFTSMDKILSKLWKSETTAIRALIRQDIYKELGVENYKFYTKADERRCEICGGMHGRIFPMSAYEVGVTAPPIHTNCRCWTEPIFSD